MASQEELRISRQDRLKEYFRQKQVLEWDDFRGEMLTMYNNALEKLKSKGCENRDFWAGKVSGLEEAMSIEDLFKDAV